MIYVDSFKELFNKYFEEVTDGKGDLDKFNKDIASEEVSKKISFDMGIAKRIDVEGTPAFYIDGQFQDSIKIYLLLK